MSRTRTSTRLIVAVALAGCSGESVPVDGDPGAYHVAIGRHLWKLDGRSTTQVCADRPLITRLGGVACAEGDSHAAGVRCPVGGCLELAACTAHEVDQGADEHAEPIEVPRCPLDAWSPGASCGDACPCWRLVPNSACAPDGDGSPYAFEVIRGGVPQAVTTELKCEVAEPAWGSEELASLPACW